MLLLSFIDSLEDVDGLWRLSIGIKVGGHEQAWRQEQLLDIIFEVLVFLSEDNIVFKMVDKFVRISRSPSSWKTLGSSKTNQASLCESQ